MSAYRLADLLDLRSVQKMAEAHYRSVGMPLGIIDAAEGSVLVGAGWQDICLYFHRVHPVSLQRCRESDEYIKQHLRAGEACQYKCKNGMWDIGLPIVVGGEHLATLFLGQFFYEGESPDRDFFIRMARDLEFDVDHYLAALDRVPVFSRDRVNSILEYNRAFAEFLSDLAERSREKLKADQVLRESERKYHAVIDQSHQFVGMLSVDGRVLEANRTALELCGLEQADVAGKPFWETPWWAHSPQLQEKLRWSVAQVARGESIRFEATHPDAAGNLHYVDFSLSPITDESGNVVLLRPEGWDITEQKAMERSLRDGQAHLRTLVQTIPDLVWLKDAEGVYQACNAQFERFFGAREADIVGKTDYDFVDRELADFFREHDRKAIAAGKPSSNEEWITFADDGHRALLETIKTPMYDGEGKLVGVLGIARDITARKNAEEEKSALEQQLQQAQKMESVGRLAGGVAHDFNNMLSVILGHAEIVMSEMSPAHELYASLEEIHQAALRSADLTRQLLAFARRQVVEPKVVDLNEAVAGMLSMLQRLIGEDIQLNWQPGRQLWPVRVDPSQFDQILANLCVNARDAIADVGQISIETGNMAFDQAYCSAHAGFVPGEYVCLAVSDTGCGIDKELLPHLFEPFFTTKRVGEGTGLGLAMVYGAVRQNGGLVHVYSEPERGTTFKLYLPRHAEDQAEVGPGPAAEMPPGGSETLLLVEDDLALLSLGKRMLEMLGYRVLSANTVAEARQLADEHGEEIDALMTDVVMPEMNGRDLAALLRKDHPALKTLFVSGYTANVIAHQGLEQEGARFLQKPFSLVDLAVKVRQTLGR